MKAFIRMMCEYSRWANARLMEDCSALSAEQLSRDFGSEFGSVHRTLDHALLMDRLWLARLSGSELPRSSTGQTLTSTFRDLQEQRLFTDQDLIAFTEALTEASLANPVRYRLEEGRTELVQPLVSALLHVFNSQSQYRAQAHCFLHMLKQSPQTLDMLDFQQQTGLGGLTFSEPNG